MEKNNIKKIMAYIYMPLFFSIFGYLIVYMAAKPVLGLVGGVGSMFIADESSGNDSSQPESIFKGTPPDTPAADALEGSGQAATYPRADVQWPIYGQEYAHMYCERIGLDGPIYYGDSYELMRKGIGHYNGTSIPGDGSPMLMVAHNTTYFAPLQKVSTGDIITVTTNYGVYQYQVTESKIADHNDDSAYDLYAEKEQLILYTCYPFEKLVGTKTDRLFVYADKISGPDLVE